jgi:PRTRC genetic system protein B
MRRSQIYKPVSLLCVYVAGNDYYVEQSPIVEEGGFYTGWKPLDEDFIKHIFRHFKSNENKITFGGYIPTNVLGYADKLTFSLMMWRTERQKVEMFFDKKLKVADGKYHVPGLVWIYGSSLELYAYKEWDGEKTELYYAPFHNITKGSVCLGTARDYIDKDKNDYTFKDIMKKVEAAFFRSRFTHSNDNSQINGSYAGMYEKSAKAFPEEVLVSAKINIKTLANEVFNS